MKKWFGFAVIGLFATVAVGPVSAQTSDELKCEINASKVVAKFASAKGKCTAKCFSAERKGETVDCLPASADGDGRDATTQTCIDAAEQKALDGQAKKCTVDCPECYNGGNCPANATSKVNTAESLFDNQDPGVHCNNTTVSADEAKCEASAGKALTKYVGALSKCSQKCNANAAKGKTDGSCSPPPGDTATQACISAADAKCAAAVDKKCVSVGANPGCWPFANGSQWCNTIKGVVNGQYNSYFCETGSASGAFLE